MTAPSPTLAALLALLDEREPLDVGPCPACVERGGGWGWRQLGSFMAGALRSLQKHGWVLGDEREDGATPAIRPCSECSEPGTEVECERLGSWLHGRHVVPGHSIQIGQARMDLCPDCDGTGKRPGPPQPTGRDRRTPGQALRDALGLRWVQRKEMFGIGAEGNARLYVERLSPAVARARQDAPPVWVVEELVPGHEPDPAARTALLVYADRLQARGDLLGQAIALALAGECRECEGEGVQGRRAALLGPWPWQPLSEVEPQNWAEPEIRECPKCNGEGAAVGELAAEIKALAENS